MKSRRGRPRSPDLLTPREHEVLALLREGLTNPEIAERLGISLDGAKYHVAEIMGKLGVQSREEAAAWSGERRSWWVLAATPWRRLANAFPAWLAVGISSGIVLAVLGGAALLVVLLARQGGGGAVLRTIDVKQLTIEDVRARALAALSQPDMVFHTIDTAQLSSGGQTYDYKQEVWVDLEQKLARMETSVNGQLQADGGLRIYHDDRIARVDSGRFNDGVITAAAGSAPLPTSALALDYMATLFAQQDVKSQKIQSAQVDDQAAILIEIVAPAGGDFAGDQTDRIYLNEQFLPIRVARQGPAGAGELAFQNEFVARDSLAGDLFSVDAVRALAKTGADRMQEAVDAGFHPYWLGDPYKDLPLYNTDISNVRGVQVLNVTYEANAEGGGPEKPPYGLTMMEFNPEGYATRLQNVDQTPWWLGPGVEQIPVDIASGKATIYRAPGQRGPEPASVFGEATPTPNATPAFNLQLVVEYADAVLLVDANIGPANPYATVEALTEVARALGPFEAAR